VRVADFTERLLEEADAVRGASAHYEEQGEAGLAAAYLQIEYGLRLVAHAFAAVHDDDDQDDGA